MKRIAIHQTATLRHWHSLLENHDGLYLKIFMPYAELLGDLQENQWHEDHEIMLPNGRTGLLETRHHSPKEHQIVECEHRYSLSGAPPQLPYATVHPVDRNGCVRFGPI